MEPKRKHGVCLPTNPIIQSQTCSQVDELINRNANCHRLDDLAKGSQQTLNETAGVNFHDIVKLSNEDCKGSEGLFRNPLDDLRQGSRNKILPVQINQNGLPSIGMDQVEALRPVEPFPYAGYVAQVLESFSLAMCLLCVKLLPVESNISEKAKACMFRGSFMMLFCALSIIYQGQSFKITRGEYLIVFFRSLFGGINILMIFVALSYITMGESSSIIYSAMVWTCLLGFFVLKEPLQISLLLALPLSALGIIFLAQPDLIVDPRQELAQWLGIQANNSTSFDNSNSSILQADIAHKVTALDLNGDITTSEKAYFANRWPGIAISIVSSFLLSVVVIILKFRKKTSIATCSFYLGLAMVIVSVGTQLIVGFGAWPTSLLECLLHVCIGAFSFCSQCLFQWALIYVPAGSYSIIQSLDTVFGFILGALFLNELVLWTSVVGSVLIMTVVVMLVLNDHLVRAFKSMCLH